uniref:Lipase maturation factor n=1 Tax=Macrostomum lignano TaxID=282301 RepID=A0A1I8I8E4_9PLAT
MSQVMVFNRFLSALNFVYLIAFVSIYVQLPGLYGDNGILPIYASISNDEVHSVQQLFSGQPSLLRLAPQLGLSYAQAAELVASLGCLLAFAACALPWFGSLPVYALLWLLYLSLFSVGQTFMWFQWDILLLEAGFLAIGLSLRLPIEGSDRVSSGLGMFAVKWLLFRLMLASGVVKLTSGCPTWWGLTALDWHYESQCLPTPLAWFSHQLPPWFQALCVVATFVIEIAVPFLFFVPVRAVRKFCFFSQLLLQCSIIVSGNYNFFNLLTICLCLSLLHDDDFSTRKGPRRAAGLKLLEWGISATLFVGLFYLTVRLFSLSVGPGFRVNSKVAFSMNDLVKFNRSGLVLSVYVGLAWLVYEVLAAVVRAALHCRGVLGRLLGLLQAMLLSAFVAFVFTASLVPHAATDEALQAQLPYAVRSVYGRTSGLEILVLEGSHSAEGPWLEFGFPHKPGNLSRAPSLAAPHQPRLDWQMWFAALGSYQQNPGCCTCNEPSVLALLDENPFAGSSPPRYIRGQLYIYRFTRRGDPDSRRGRWWRRELQAEYLQPVNLATMARFAESQGISKIPPPPPKPTGGPSVSSAVAAAAARLATAIRAAIGQPDGFWAVASASVTAACVRMASGAVLAG